MKIGFIGLGKLGFPVALSIAMKGHDVKGYDIQEPIFPWPFKESGPNGLGSINDHPHELVEIASMDEVIDHAEILFIAVQTPNSPQCEGITPYPVLEDFDYTFLTRAWYDVQERVTKPTRVAIISTVLPGTCKTLLNDNPHISFAYNPYFIAMGTVMRDFFHPEFILNGGVDLSDFYKTITNAPVIRMSIESAELTKVAYNTFIGMKIAFGNLLGEICHKSGADVDDVTEALSRANMRLISPKYLTAGMGDGGACHPRDNIALSWYAQQNDLHHDLFGDIMRCREGHAKWLSNMLKKEAEERGIPTMILGLDFKPETNIKTGSHALLVASFRSAALCVDHYTTDKPFAILIGCKNPNYAKLKFVQGSVVIDPFRYIPQQEGVHVIQIGRAPEVLGRASSDEMPGQDTHRFSG